MAPQKANGVPQNKGPRKSLAMLTLACRRFILASPEIRQVGTKIVGIVLAGNAPAGNDAPAKNDMGQEFGQTRMAEIGKFET